MSLFVKNIIFFLFVSHLSRVSNPPPVDLVTFFFSTSFFFSQCGSLLFFFWWKFLVHFFPTELDVFTIFAPVISVPIFFLTQLVTPKRKKEWESNMEKVTAILISFYDERRHTTQPPTFSFQLTNRTTRSRNLEIKVGCCLLMVGVSS